MAVGEDDAAGLVNDEARGMAGSRDPGVEGARRRGVEDDDGGHHAGERAAPALRRLRGHGLHRQLAANLRCHSPARQQTGDGGSPAEKTTTPLQLPSPLPSSWPLPVSRV